MVKPRIKINIKICLACGGCISICPQDALSMISSKAYLEDEPIGAIKEDKK